MEILIGRKEEQRILRKALESRKAEMIAVVGRRRVGKTHLIDTVYQDYIIFKQTGVQNVSADKQLRTFTNTLQIVSGEKNDVPKDWLDAF